MGTPLESAGPSSMTVTNSARPCSPWLRCAVALLTLLLASAGIGAPAAGPEPTVRYRVEITAPSAIRDVLLQELDLIHWQAYADVSDEFLEQLVADARQQATDIAATLGYFSAQVNAEIVGEVPPLVRIVVDPGEPTRVASVDIKIEGTAADGAAADSAQIAALKAGWSLPAGAIFTQTAWDRAKAAALLALSNDRYAAARITASKADIDPDTHTARLAVTLDSGPAFYFGELTVTGLSRYPESFVRNQATFAPGEPYTQQRLDQFVRRLNAAGYFASVHARIDNDPAQADAAPIRVTVVEAPTKTVTGGIGYSTDTLYRATLSYSDANIDDAGLQFRSDLRLESKLQNVSVQFIPPPRAPGYADIWAAKVEHTDIEGLVTQEVVGGWSRRTTDERDPDRVYDSLLHLAAAAVRRAEQHRTRAVCRVRPKLAQRRRSLVADARLDAQRRDRGRPAGCFDRGVRARRGAGPRLHSVRSED